MTGRQLRLWRRKNSYSVRGLAAALEVAKSTIQRWENDDPRPPRMAELALERLDVRPTRVPRGARRPGID
jgi:DNA-binding transcriptional regulator YiaG